jgi:hypothetical protein
VSSAGFNEGKSLYKLTNITVRVTRGTQEETQDTANTCNETMETTVYMLVDKTWYKEEKGTKARS